MSAAGPIRRRWRGASVVFLTVVSPGVIPGRALLGAGPESITTVASWRHGCGDDLRISSAWGYGFRARLRTTLLRGTEAPRNDTQMKQVSEAQH